MIFYNSENDISKTIPNKTFAMFELSHCSRHKAILSSIVVSQQYCGEYFILFTVPKSLWDLTTKYYWNRTPLTLLVGSGRNTFETISLASLPTHALCKILKRRQARTKTILQRTVWQITEDFNLSWLINA